MKMCLIDGCHSSNRMIETYTCTTAEETFDLGDQIGKKLNAGDVLLLSGGLGAGKTLLTKGILKALDFDTQEVTSPSFALVNLYRTPKFNVYHIDLWRIPEGGDAAFAVGLSEILEDLESVIIIEWAERLGGIALDRRVAAVNIGGEGDEPRKITIESRELSAQPNAGLPRDVQDSPDRNSKQKRFDF